LIPRLPFLAFFLVFVYALLSGGALRATPGAETSLEVIGEEAYQAVKKFFEYDPAKPLEARVVERKEEEESIREKIVYRGVRGFLVPGYLEWPKGRGEGPYPIVLLLHGWSGSRESGWKEGGYLSGSNLRQSLLEKGFAIFAIDAQTHGERMAENDYGMVNDYTPEGGEALRKNYFTLPEIYQQTVCDYRRGLDYLATRPEVDSERIGALGYSMGGTQTFVLTSVESRIKVSVACVTPAMAGKYDPVSPKNFARGIQTQPFLMLMGKEDTMCPIEHAEALLQLLPTPTKKLLWYDSGHKLPLDYVQDAIPWFVDHLE
jgi:dipeptidyl aminopeptidase/acylaminoacyl peptidase